MSLLNELFHKDQWFFVVISRGRPLLTVSLSASSEPNSCLLSARAARLRNSVLCVNTFCSGVLWTAQPVVHSSLTSTLRCAVLTQRRTYPENVLICMQIAFLCGIIKGHVIDGIRFLSPCYPVQENIYVQLSRHKMGFSPCGFNVYFLACVTHVTFMLKYFSPHAYDFYTCICNYLSTKCLQIY